MEKIEYPRFQIGDTVRVDDWDSLKLRSGGEGYDGCLYGFSAGFVSGMRNYCGRVAVVAEISVRNRDRYRLQFDDERGRSVYLFSPDMFDLSFGQSPEIEQTITDEEFFGVLIGEEACVP